ncbi:hypothetical protein LTR91_024762 [Friedmanniomyces endolithicus]|uniref:Histidine kinase group protein n=1 Tax=Friedmanniomyces endolithicus TaxID=329885 RepID=A0A4U0UTW0_9PEZI|nr:hypothetical protein LTS09_012485 [Friedmanniomyces endolithicus]KAK0266038.1 hypothetical protein LTR35_016953 [Friedmanniomyces endolithicus]KAK0272225.1 hypothetical protein LTS00_016312 [Friedmanniomyces endolithicus]KAK0305495.1 hypothetical protein LTR82_016726 [Friedmanniomyces endolithicus]KAK0926178.1 hypothetical protein LTR57_004429 [Friedmanniomyces endolithicus]
MTKKKAGAHSASADTPPPPSSLIICRNKHWRYISSFHGPWLQLPPEILESLAHQNYTMPAPRLVDPAVFYDVVNIRKAVDEAAQDSVRASTGVSNTGQSGRMDYFGAPSGPASQLSKERIYKIRQKAVKLLSKAFALDEVAASVATMQATSTVEDVARHVLKREGSNTDAKYVHFFHEKIPSRCMEQYTPLDPLDDVIASLPSEHQGPPLRTRALVQIFKSQWDGAAADLTMALRITEEIKRTHQPNQQQLELASRMREEQESWSKGHKDWRSVPHLKEEDQPKSLEQQLYFNRAGVYLTIACRSVHAALDGLKEYQEAQERGEANGVEAKAQAVRLEARKKVKTYAKRAMRDYLAFLSHFDYTPGLPFEITNEIMRRVYDLANGNKTPTPLPKNRLVELDNEEKEVNGVETNGNDHSASAITKHSNPKPEPFERGEEGWPSFPSPKIHPASALFAERPPSDIPPFPNDKTMNAMLDNEPLHEAFGSREAVTYHPLLTDALHSLLLAHSLLQTSPTELLRHAHNAARLARIADGYPIFQAARSPARADWIEVLRRANNWLGLSVPWQKLCAPAPLPEAAGGWAKDSAASSSSAASSQRQSRSGGSSPTHPAASALATRQKQGRQQGLQLVPREETAEQKRERIKQESIIDALSDDRVVDEESFQRAVRARERRAMEDEEGISGPLMDKRVPALAAPPPTSSSLSSVPTTTSTTPTPPPEHSTAVPAPDDASTPTPLPSATTPNPNPPTSTPSTSATTAPCPSPQRQPPPQPQPQLPQPPQQQQPKRWAPDDSGREYPISTDRAEAIARWIREAPLSMGAGSGTGRKRRPARKGGRKGGAGEGLDGSGLVNGVVNGGVNGGLHGGGEVAGGGGQQEEEGPD